MKKHINLLLVGFLLFIVGLITINFELVKYEFVNHLPNNFKTTTDTFYVNTDLGKDYIINAARYNDNLKIVTNVNNNLKDKIMIEITHAETSVVTSHVKNNMYNTEITFSNEIKLNKDSFKDIYMLLLRCITEKKIYNYNLLKYGQINVYGSEESLSRLELDKK